MADDRGNPQPARSARPLSLALSYAVLCAVQAAIVLTARPPKHRGRTGVAGVAIPALLLIAGVVLIRSTGSGPHALAYAGAVGTPLLAAAGRWRIPLARRLEGGRPRRAGCVRRTHRPCCGHSRAARRTCRTGMVDRSRSRPRRPRRRSPRLGHAAGRARDDRVAHGGTSGDPAPPGCDLRLGDDGLARPSRSCAPRRRRPPAAARGRSHGACGGRLGAAVGGHVDRARDGSRARRTSFGRC